VTDLFGQFPCLDRRDRYTVRMAYELRSGSEILARLEFRNMFGTFATAESADGCWTFKRVGFWHHRASIRMLDMDDGAGAVVATM